MCLKAREKTRKERVKYQDNQTYLDGPGRRAPTDNRRPDNILPAKHKPATSYVKDFKHDKEKGNLAKKGDLDNLGEQVKILSLTTFFETGKKIDDAYGIVAGNFDKMGISFGCLQWNLGQQTLQPIFKRYFKYSQPDEWKNNELLVELKDTLKLSLSEQLQWANSIQTEKW